MELSLILLNVRIWGFSRPSPRWRHFDVISLFGDGVKVMSSLQCGVTMMSVFRIGRRNPILSLKSPFWVVHWPPKALLKWPRFEARYGFRAIRFQVSAISPESDSGNRPPEGFLQSLPDSWISLFRQPIPSAVPRPACRIPLSD